MSDSQQPHGLQPTRLLRPWDFPGKSTGVGCHHLLCSQSMPPVYLSIPPFFFFFKTLDHFSVIILNSLSSRLCFASSFVWSGGVLPYFLACCIFFCLFIVFSLLWSLTCGCGRMDQRLVKVSWLEVMCLCSGGWSWISSL